MNKKLNCDISYTLYILIFIIAALLNCDHLFFKLFFTINIFTIIARIFASIMKILMQPFSDVFRKWVLPYTLSNSLHIHVDIYSLYYRYKCFYGAIAWLLLTPLMVVSIIPCEIISSMLYTVYRYR